MKKHSLVRKSIVFIIFFIALVVIAPTIIFYSLGYRLDKNNSSVIRSGSIVVKTTPSNPEILIDGKKVDQTNIDLINRTLNINGLEPRNYQLEVTAPGYHSWKKNVEVQSGIATEYWNIILVPEDLETNFLAEDNIVKCAFSPDKNKIAYYVVKNDTISLLVRDQNQAQDIFVYKESLNQRFAPEPGELKWSPDSQWLLFSLMKGNEERIFFGGENTGFAEVIDLGSAWREVAASDGSNKGTANKSKATDISNYAWDDRENIMFVLNKKFYIQPAGNIYNLYKQQTTENQNIGTEKPEQPGKVVFKGNNTPVAIKENVNGFTTCGSYLCSVNVQEKKLEIFNQSGNLSQFVSFPENYQMTEEYQLFAYADNRVAILDKAENLFLWDETQNKTEEKEGMRFIFSGVKEVYFSDDGKKILFSTKNEAYVYFAREWEVQPKHSAGDLEVVYRDPEELQTIQWFLDYQNVFVVNKDGVKMIELDSRGGRNAADFLKNPNIKEANYDAGARKLWYLEDDGSGVKKLFEITFPVAYGLFSGIMNSASTP